MRSRNPYAIPVLLIALGTGLVAWHGEILWRHDSLPPAEVAARADRMLEELEARRGPHLSPITGARREALIEQLRAEIRGQHEQPLRDSQRWFFGGLACLVIGLGHVVMVRMSRLAP